LIWQIKRGGHFFSNIDKYSSIWYLWLASIYPLKDINKKRIMWDGSPQDVNILPLLNEAMEVSEKNV